MNAIFLTLFVSFVLLLGMVLLFAFLFAHHNHEQTDRLSLLPLQDEQAGNQSQPAEQGAAPILVRNVK